MPTTTAQPLTKEPAQTAVVTDLWTSSSPAPSGWTLSAVAVGSSGGKTQTTSPPEAGFFDDPVMIALVVILSVIVLCVPIVVVFCFIQRRRRKALDEESEPESTKVRTHSKEGTYCTETHADLLILNVRASLLF